MLPEIAALLGGRALYCERKSERVLFSRTYRGRESRASIPGLQQREEQTIEPDSQIRFAWGNNLLQQRCGVISVVKVTQNSGADRAPFCGSEKIRIAPFFPRALLLRL